MSPAAQLLEVGEGSFQAREHRFQGFYFDIGPKSARFAARLRQFLSGKVDLVLMPGNICGQCLHAGAPVF